MANLMTTCKKSHTVNNALLEVTWYHSLQPTEHHKADILIRLDSEHADAAC